MLGIAAYDVFVSRWIPESDRSGDVATAISSRYESKVGDLAVRQVNDIRVATDFPFNYTNLRTGYRAQYRLDGIPLTFHIAGYGPEDFVKDGDRYLGVFPDELGLTDSEFAAVLNAYAAGSGASSFNEMRNLEWLTCDESATVTLGNGDSYAKKWTFAIYDQVDDLRSFGGESELDAHIVAFDPKTGKATYLGLWRQLKKPNG